MATATITSKGQITIPVEIRRQLGLKPGDRIDFVPGPNGDVTIKTKKLPFERLRGILKSNRPKPATIREMDEDIARFHQQEWERIRKQRTK
jgi:antitoxin PrlF